jgi:hypothetical protein
MTKFFIAETDVNASVNNSALWKPTKAATLASAKRAAQAARVFQGTAAHVATQAHDGSFVRIAVRHPAGSVQAGWTDF